MDASFDYQRWADELGMPMLQQSLDEVLAEAVTVGHAHLAGALRPDALGSIERELGMQYFEPAAKTLNGVTQNFTHWEAGFPTSMSWQVSRLGHELHFAVRHGTVRELATWEPTEVAAQTYPECPVGIGAHRDFRGCQLLIVVVNVCGRARFEIREEDRATVRTTYEVGLGDIVLLRGSGVIDGEGRPLHAVTQVRGPRTSLTYRMVVR